MRRKRVRFFTTLLTVIVLFMSVGYPMETVGAATRKPTKITLTEKKITLYVKQSTTLKVKSVSPARASKSVTWKSSNSRVATVNSRGKITAKRSGSATITAYSRYNRRVKVSCKVTVKNPTIKFKQSKLTVNSNQDTYLKPEVKGASKKVSYSMSKKDQKIASVNSKGRVRFKKAGTVTVTASANGKKASIKIKAVKPSLSISPTSATIYLTGSKSIQLNAKTYGASKKISWSVSNKSYATVTNGKVVAKKAGTVKVYAKANGLTKYCTIKIRPVQERVTPVKVKLGKDTGYRYTVSSDMKYVKTVSGVRTFQTTSSDLAKRQAKVKKLSGYKTNLSAIFFNMATKNSVFTMAGVKATVTENKTDYKKIVISGKSPSFDGTYEIRLTKKNNTYTFTTKKGTTTLPSIAITASLKNGMYTLNIAIGQFKFIAYVKADGTQAFLYTAMSRDRRLVVSYTSSKNKYEFIYNRTYLNEMSSFFSLFHISDNIGGFIDHARTTVYYK
ncbi:MAG: Ig-like domain-containing protein [bacterium]|nr:Ig-like domain-containing protein [bacterium]